MKKRRVYLFLMFISILLMAVGLGILGFRLYDDIRVSKISSVSEHIVNMSTDVDYVKEESLLDLLREEFNNDEVIAFLDFSDIGIRYPIMQCDNNRYYLNYDPYGNYSVNGSVFLDSDCSSNFEDVSSVVYGHKTVGDTMFGVLERNTGNSFKGKSFKIYLEDRVLTYDVVSVEWLSANDRSYFIEKSDLNLFRDTLEKFGERYKGTELGEKYVTLITCSYTRGYQLRYGCTGCLVSTEYYGGSK